MAGLPLACLLPLLALGCAADPGEEAAALMRQALATTRASLAATGAPQGPAPAAGPAAPAAAPRAAAPVPPAGTPRQRGAAPPAAAAALLGLRADQLRRMLGDPSIRRPEGPAEIWLYEAPSCRLDVILYAEGSALVVGHAAARALGAGESVTEAACLSAIATAPAPPPWTTTGRRA